MVKNKSMLIKISKKNLRKKIYSFRKQIIKNFSGHHQIILKFLNYFTKTNFKKLKFLNYYFLKNSFIFLKIFFG